jgi:hypothetical protein
MGQTKIHKAIELVKEIGKEQAIEYFKKQIVIPKDFQDVCNNSGNEIAIRYIIEKL